MSAAGLAPDDSWVPSPTYLLRRDWILRVLDSLPRGGLLEVGCGAGALLRDAALLGFQCTGLETSPAAVSAGRERNADLRVIDIVDEGTGEWDAAFDYLVACEVLEHVEDDLGALRRWVSWLRPGGHVVLSVPAHKRRWNASDDWAGHVRRYERNELRQLVVDAGLQVQELVCYGFPLSNLLQPLRAGVHRRQRDTLTRGARVARSGLDRGAERRLYPLLDSVPGRLVMSAFAAAQRPFFQTELGNGYLCHAVKPAPPASH
jgi:SAM-dependent methyltransferase